MRIEILFLGTGTIASNPERFPSSCLIRVAGLQILVDLGPGIFRRLIDVGIEPLTLDYVFLTHFHADHITDLLPFLFQKKYSPGEHQKTTVCVHHHFTELLPVYEKLLNIPMEELAGVEWIFSKEGSSILLPENSGLVTPYPMNHKPESLGYAFELGSHRIAFSGDTDLCDSLKELLLWSDLAVIECSNHEKSPVEGHMDPSKWQKMLSDIPDFMVNRKQIFMNHFYPEALNSDILRALLQQYPNIRLSHDLLTITLEV